jgi:hypothetical protein
MKSVEALAATLAPIASVMIHCELSAGELVRAAKLAFLREAMADMARDGSRINISRLSVVTGMTRKEVTGLIKAGSGSRRDYPGRRSMEHRALRVLRGWATDPLYKTGAGRPAELPLDGEGRTFPSLVRAYGGDVTPKSVLRELERLNAIVHTRSGKLRPRSRSAKLKLHAAEQLRAFSTAIAGFSTALVQTLGNTQTPLYFGFKEISVRGEKQAARFRQSFSRRAAMLLEAVDHWSGQESSKPEKVDRSRHQRLGLGVYVAQRDDADPSANEMSFERRARRPR